MFVYGEHAPDLADLKHLYPTFEYVQEMKTSSTLPTIEAQGLPAPHKVRDWGGRWDRTGVDRRDPI